MAVFVSGYIKDLSAVKDNITLRVRVLRCWTQEIYNKPHVKNLEMVLMDENVSIRFLMCNFLVHIDLVWVAIVRGQSCPRIMLYMELLLEDKATIFIIHM